MSLKLNLHNLIKAQGHISLQQLEDYCHKAKYKLATAERQLRPSQSPQIEGVWNPRKTAIIGYKWRSGNSTEKSVACCSDMAAFNQHFGECKNATIKEPIGQLF